MCKCPSGRHHFIHMLLTLLYFLRDLYTTYADTGTPRLSYVVCQLSKRLRYFVTSALVNTPTTNCIKAGRSRTTCKLVPIDSTKKKEKDATSASQVTTRTSG